MCIAGIGLLLSIELRDTDSEKEDLKGWSRSAHPCSLVLYTRFRSPEQDEQASPPLLSPL